MWRRQQVVGEYQGPVHAGIRNRSMDSYRNGLVEDEGWRVLEIFAEDVFDAPRRVGLLSRFAGALALDPRGLRIELSATIECRQHAGVTLPHARRVASTRPASGAGGCRVRRRCGTRGPTCGRGSRR